MHSFIYIVVFGNNNMKSSLIIFLIGLTQYVQSQSFFIDIHSIDANTQIKYFSVACERNIHINFYFNENTKVQCNDKNCQLRNGQESYLYIYDKKHGQYWNMTLEQASFSNQSYVRNRSNSQWKSFSFKFKNSQHTFYVIIPITNNLQQDENKIYLQKLPIDGELEAFYFFKNLRSVSEFSPVIFNFLNLRDYGLFYAVSNFNSQISILLSILIYIPRYNYLSEAINSTFPQVDIDYRTATRSCYGSQERQGIFLTHLADNYPLWTGWMGLFFFWAFYIITEKNNPKCFQERFQNNKWTSWSVYSLIHLAHNQFFSKPTRLTSMMLTFSFQALILSIILHATHRDYETSYAAWVIPITILTAQPVSYLFGYVFIRRCYIRYFDKFQSISRLNHYLKYDQPISLKQKHIMQKDVLLKEESLYQIYFLYYGIAMPLILACWAISVHLMQVSYFENQHLHPIWTYCFVSSWAADIFVIQPILCFFWGSKNFFRNRGFYYNYELGMRFRNANKKIYLAKLDL